MLEWKVRGPGTCDVSKSFPVLEIGDGKSMRKIWSIKGFLVVKVLFTAIFALFFLLGCTVTPKDEEARIFVETIPTVPLEAFRQDIGRYPTTEEGLEALIVPPDDIDRNNWRGPYVDVEQMPDDPWGRPYEYRSPGEVNEDSYDLFSWGTDEIGIIGNWSEDDVQRMPYQRDSTDGL